MKKLSIFIAILACSSLMAWAIYKNSTANNVSLKKAKSHEFELSDTQKLCINEFLKIQKFYSNNKIFKASLLKSIVPEGGKGEKLKVEVLCEGSNYIMNSEIASVTNNDEFFAQIDHESKNVVIGYPNTENPLGFKFADLKNAFKDSLIWVNFKKTADLASISYINKIENTVTDISYHFSSGEIIRITETFYDYWEEEAELTKITEDCIIQSFQPLTESFGSDKFKFTNYIEQKDSVFSGKGIYKDYEIADTRYKN